MDDNLILDKLDRPAELEEVYRTSPRTFERLFVEAFSARPESEALKVWKARLEYGRAASTRSASMSPLYFVVIASFLSGYLAKLPAFIPAVPGSWFYPRFVPLFVIAPIILFFMRSGVFDAMRKGILGSLALCLLYLFLLPNDLESSSVLMALIHMPLVLATLLGLAYVSSEWKNLETRLRYVRYVGEVGIYSVLILAGGVILTALTLALFGLIGVDIIDWYMTYVVVFGLVAAPLVATYLHEFVLGRESRLAVVLSNVFSPLFLLTVFAYLLASLASGKSPHADRDFLIVFNGLLVVIWAIAVYSVSGRKAGRESTLIDAVNIGLISITLLINLVALSAILFRWAEYGTTPNRVVVTGANILIFTHLILILFQYVKWFRLQDDVKPLNDSIARYLPVYSVWAFFVVFLLPVLFRFA